MWRYNSMFTSQYNANSIKQSSEMLYLYIIQVMNSKLKLLFTLIFRKLDRFYL